VKSEIVIPILKSDLIVGELDIDSRVASPFTAHDRNYLTIIAKMASELL
jgi:putative methionine-R-sulfoxide reductase with GAF domain